MECGHTRHRQKRYDSRSGLDHLALREINAQDDAHVLSFSRTGILPVILWRGEPKYMKTPELTTYRRKLPHWRIEGSTYFVTWRLAKIQPVLNPEERGLVANAIRYFDGERYELLAYVIMDNHVHVLLLPLADYSLKQIVHSWKSFTSNRLRQLRERQAPIWQDEYFDRIVRNEAELIEKAQYILGNPFKRWPEAEDYPWAGYGQWNI